MRKIYGALLVATISTLAWSVGGNVEGTKTGTPQTGTANRLARYLSNGQLGNSAQITDDGTNVGIGTASPATKLDVNGTITATGLSVPTGSMTISTLTVDSNTIKTVSGKSGFGTTSPATTVDVNGDFQAGSGANKSTFTATGSLQAVSGFNISNSSVSIVGATSGFSVGGSTLNVNNGNVCIGDRTCSQPLFIKNDGGASATDNLIQIQTTGDGGIGRHFGIDTNNDLMYDRLNDGGTYGWTWQNASGSNNLMTLTRNANGVASLSVTGGLSAAYGVSAATFTATGFIQSLSRTSAQLLAIAPSAVGQQYFCSDCSPTKMVVSTGTSAGNFADPAGGAFK